MNVQTPNYAALRALLPEPEFALARPLIEEINALKRERDVVILVHNYQIPSIYHGIADYTGDSLGLSVEAAKTRAATILFCGVHFMAETAKIVSPEKQVLIPDLEAGCSLSESITPDDVRTLRALHPGVPVVCYVNTEADIKAESDVCCTSANAAKVVRSLPGRQVIFIPDAYLGQNVGRETGKEVIVHDGRCIVHQEFTAEQIAAYRAQFPGIYVVAHPECHPSVVAAADFTGSTSQMVAALQRIRPGKAMLITECSMAANIQLEVKHIDFDMPCTLCPHMKRITLEKVLRSLQDDVYEVEVPEPTRSRAAAAIHRMLEIGA
ncbi:MAG: quinolinate synthase NadA [Deltaproteobacteria bacterium]|nr:quinolinate synthase NadA [Deltaproteobacteria bacterium]